MEVTLNCSFEVRGGTLHAVPGRPSRLLGIPFDRPVVGYGGTTINTLRLWAAARRRVLRLRGVQPRGVRQRGRGEPGRGIPDAGALSRRLHEPRPGAPLRPGGVPRHLLARRSRAAVPAWQCRLEPAAREGGHPAQRHPPRPRRRRADADPARRRAPRVGRGLASHPPDAGVHEPHPAPRGAREVAAGGVPAVAAAPPGDHLRDQPSSARRGPDPLSRRRGPGPAGEPHRGRPGPARPHGQPRDRRLAQHQRRGRHPLQAPAHGHGQGPRRDVPGALQQQDERRDAAALAPSRQSQPGRCHHRGHRRRVDHGPRRNWRS